MKVTTFSTEWCRSMSAELPRFRVVVLRDNLAATYFASISRIYKIPAAIVFRPWTKNEIQDRTWNTIVPQSCCTCDAGAEHGDDRTDN